MDASTCRLLGAWAIRLALIAFSTGMSLSHAMKIEEMFGALPFGDGLVPLWFWQDRMPEGLIVAQMEDMKKHGITECFIIYPVQKRDASPAWLSEEWLAKVKFAAETAKKLGMKVCIHDEHGYPSGAVEGRMVQINPEFRGKHLAVQVERVAGPVHHSVPLPGGRLVNILASRADGATLSETPTDLTERAANGRVSWDAPSGQWQVMIFVERDTDWVGGGHGQYVDPLNPQVAQKFIELTHERYASALRSEFGATIPLIFTDEPGFYQWYKHKGAIPWTARFPKVFREKKGYDLEPCLPALWFDIGPRTRKVRFDYYDALSSLYSEAFFKPLYDWCARNNIGLSGHLNNEEHLGVLALTEGHFFRPLRYFQVPGVDNVFNMNKPWVVKLGSSAAHMYKRDRCLDEAFGGFGWHTSLETMKTVTDMMFVEGANLIVPHAYWSSVSAGYAPPAVSPPSTWWPYFRAYSDYAKRLTRVLSRGTHVANVALYYPMPSVWANITPDGQGVASFDASFLAVSSCLRANQYDFDYLDDDALQRAQVGGGEIRLNGEVFGTLVLPRLTSMPAETLGIVREFCRGGGQVIAVESLPSESCALRDERGDAKVLEMVKEIFGNVDASGSAPSGHAFGRGKGFFFPTSSAFDQALARHVIVPDVSITPRCPDIRYLHRVVEGRHVYFMTNSSEKAVRTTATFLVKAIPSYCDIETGTLVKVLEYVTDGRGCSLPLRLGPHQAALLIFEDSQEQPHATATNLAGIVGLSSDREGLTVTALGDRDGAFFVEAEQENRKWRGEVRITGLAPAIALKGAWHWTWDSGSEERGLGDWTGNPGLEFWSGTMRYSREFELPVACIGRPLVLDLGEVRDIAEVWLNGRLVGIRCWKPFRLDVSAFVCPGKNKLEVRVTNTLANRMEKKPIPSGLFGPVTLMPHALCTLKLQAN